jgi:CHAD domain-containing protein
MPDEQPDSFPLLNYLDGLVDDLRTNVPKAIKDNDADAIHDARVATRRLKAAMDLLTPVISDRYRKPFGKVTRQLRRRLGPLRDSDVMLEHLKQIRAARHARAVGWLRQKIEETRQKAIKDAADDLPPPRVLARLGLWWGLHQQIAETQEGVDCMLAESVHLQLDAFAEQADRLVNPPTESAERNDPHQLRIAGKSLRYTLEMAREHGHPLPKRVSSTFKKLQESLGQWHDYVVLTERALCESVDDLLPHHDAVLQRDVLNLAALTLKRAETHLAKVAEFWKRDGETLTKEIREHFPLTKPVETIPAPQPEPDTSAAPAA